MVGIFDGLNHVLSLVLSYAFAISIVATLFAPIPYNSLPITLKLYIGLFGSIDSLGDASSFKKLVEIVAVDVSNGLRSRRKLVVATQFCDMRLDCTLNRISCQIIGGVKSARLEEDTSVSEAVLS